MNSEHTLHFAWHYKDTLPERFVIFFMFRSWFIEVYAYQ